MTDSAYSRHSVSDALRISHRSEIVVYFLPSIRNGIYDKVIMQVVLVQMG
jgi:hypothetical protein